MDNNRIIELLARKQANEATPRELEELKELMTSFPDAQYFDEVVSEIWAQREDMPGMNEEELDAFYQSHELKFRKELGFKTPEAGFDVTQSPIDQHIPIQKKLNSWFKTNYNLLGVACGIFIIAMASFFFLKNNAKEFDTQVFSGKGTRKKILLPDGTLVWLNAESSLSYDSHLDEEKQRLVYLVGEAFFDVSHRRNRPFVVRTKELSVKVLGTAFNVKAYAKEKGTEATLLRGSIELSMNNQPAQKIVLKPSEKFATATQQKNNLNKKVNQQKNILPDLIIEHIVPVRIAGSEYIEETSWKDNMLVFQNESLEDLKPRLERWFNIHIELGATIPKGYRFTGVLKNENIKEALTAMQLIKPFHFKLKADDVIIY
ncbi:FecR domain-containing protein [Pedobacter sp. PLR]|uniref:FecR family protein n=1 Tax=Pedobacter sp. PLR TaxID=2994465 RepID=UPI002246DCA6|nr:FecR domain-containing protein [Pedobacter sp. PLR]MCX2450990.1 FecR domain-containing protein [Pedobacter sp. PLR]